MVSRSHIAAVVVAALLLGGCAGGGPIGSSLVTTGGYELYDCQQLALTLAGLVERDQNLTRYMERARQSAGGSVVSAISYEPDYASNRASIREVEREQVEKKCDPAKPAPAVVKLPDKRS
jgi:hypothetical protein